MGVLDLFKKHKITNENWEFYQSYDENERVVFTTIDLTYSEPESQKGFEGELFIRIRIPEDRLDDGIPTPEEQHSQNAREDELCNMLIKRRVKCMQVGRLTFGGQKQYVFEYNDLEGFQQVFDEWKGLFNKDYTLELNLLQPFEYYRDLLPDQYIWQQIGNRHVIDQLVAAGSDETKEHFIEHGIFGKEEDLKRLWDELKEKDIEMIQMEGDFLEVGIKSSIDLDDITNQTDYLLEMAEKHNCKYDGWNTAVME